MTEKRARRTYAEEQKQQLAALSNQGKSRSEIIREYDLTGSAFDRWVKRINATGSSHKKDNRTPKERELVRSAFASIHGNETLIVLNIGTAACGTSVAVKAVTNCTGIAVSQGYGAQRLKAGGADAGDAVTINSLSANVAVNDSKAAHDGFFPYVQDGMSRHTAELDGSAIVLFDFTERERGVST